jgi:hypothetical protein
MTGVVDTDLDLFTDLVEQLHIKHVLEKPFTLEHFLKAVRETIQ